jgi:hypothetical protein
MRCLPRASYRRTRLPLKVALPTSSFSLRESSDVDLHRRIRSIALHRRLFRLVSPYINRRILRRLMVTSTSTKANGLLPRARRATMQPGKTSIPAAGQPHRPHQTKLPLPPAGCPPGLSQPDLRRLLPGFLPSLMTTTTTTARTYHSKTFTQAVFTTFSRASKGIVITMTTRTEITTTLVARATAIRKVSSSDRDIRHHVAPDMVTTTTTRMEFTTTLGARATVVRMVSSSDWDMRHYLATDTKSRAKSVQPSPRDFISEICPTLCATSNSLRPRKRRLP